MTVTLFIPVKNEIDGLKAIMPRIKKEWVDEILIIDGSSTDGSQEYLETHGYDFVIQKSKGVRGAFWEAFELAKGEVIILFSPDNNSVPEDIPLLIEKIKEGHDLVIASRYYQGMKSDDDDFMSRLGNKVFTGLINILFRARYSDAMTMYKAFPIKLLHELRIDENRNNDFAEIAIVCRAARRKLKIVEIPSHEQARIGGPPGSRAHPGLLGKYKSALVLFKMIIRDWLFFV
jgi:glycosyltransferase involved in cell wall biosynthesis